MCPTRGSICRSTFLAFPHIIFRRLRLWTAVDVAPAVRDLAALLRRLVEQSYVSLLSHGGVRLLPSCARGKPMMNGVSTRVTSSSITMILLRLLPEFVVLMSCVGSCHVPVKSLWARVCFAAAALQCEESG